MKLWDLTCSNPPGQGLRYAKDVLSGIYSRSANYEPSALGMPVARDAVVAYLRGHGRTVSPSQIWIGAGTSELYGHTMSILCEPGDTWLVPQPGYPLFSYLSDLQGVQVVPYSLSWDGGWHLGGGDFLHVLSRSNVKAIAVVSPHNPTGHVCPKQEWEMVVRCCAEREIALVVDEVFLDYPLEKGVTLASMAGEQRCLTICLSGVSKVAAFPQGKLAWAVVSGPGSEEFLGRAELVADTFLNASTVIQQGLPCLLDAAPAMQERIRARGRRNLAQARTLLTGTAMTVCDVEAGWTLLLRLPGILEDQIWAERALLQQHVLVQPGYLFEMEQVHPSPFIALSLLVEPAVFDEGLQRLVRLVEEEVG